MGKVHILIVEDEADIQQLVSYNLIRAGFHVTCADTGEEGLQSLKSETIDCILLDLMLPGLSGIEVCTEIKKGRAKEFSHVPIIMLTAKGEEEDVITGLECGADDYITKPFSPKVLMARIKAVLRRSAAKKEDSDDGRPTIIMVGNLTINKGKHQVLLDDQEIQLTATEFGILSLLAGKTGWVFTRQQIIDSVRGYDFLITPRAIDVQIFGLRKKLGDAGGMIETVRGIGYRFKSPDDQDEGQEI
ncbi:response regulator transcription factor [Desulfopila aestuarii]|uniref:Two-component system, OmpR family, phosphate regulon response regulator PhoB n=1 Tax=Desulfopila aestuarii DSM 18488 TaxID=1121416 RepID=A0A1M7XZL2_9BACT|nr:response regulator transcription factor [Desulfopila aestuarii]SHO44656.1 two-component system, OmpR family, phosphate regulon response regulator PhoB [Desulfopila aestuarii DSM 18488]